MALEEEFIWVNRWEDFQSFQKKRGKPWTPPWVKIHTRLLDEPAFLELPPETRMLLVGIWTLFARSRLTLSKDTRSLSRSLHQRVLTRQLERLNRAGFISFCSGTVLERRKAAFWNGSTLEVEVEEEGSNSSSRPVETVDNVDNSPFDFEPAPREEPPHDLHELLASTASSLRKDMPL